jgi:hypothetical protein
VPRHHGAVPTNRVQLVGDTDRMPDLAQSDRRQCSNRFCAKTAQKLPLARVNVDRCAGIGYSRRWFPANVQVIRLFICPPCFLYSACCFGIIDRKADYREDHSLAPSREAARSHRYAHIPDTYSQEGESDVRGGFAGASRRAHHVANHGVERHLSMRPRTQRLDHLFKPNTLRIAGCHSLEHSFAHRG